MPTARDESGFGAGGKFKKRPFRRTTQSTPYDRPLVSAALRNPANVNINNNNGWLSKFVDPAQRLIVSSAHRLFRSVFRKRLPPPPPPPALSEAPEPGWDSLFLEMLFCFSVLESSDFSVVCVRFVWLPCGNYGSWFDCVKILKGLNNSLMRAEPW